MLSTIDGSQTPASNHELGDTLTWPVNPEGRLPNELFTTEYIHLLLFDAAPRVFKLPTAAIRRGLKAHAKKTAGARLEQALSGLQGETRDKALVELICQNGKIRSKFSSIEFLPPNKNFPVKIEGFAWTIWTLGFRSAEDKGLNAIAKWFDKASVPDKSRIRKKIILADTFTKAIENEQPPCALEDLAFARAVLVFASLLSEGSRDELLRVASERGVRIPLSCTPDCRTGSASEVLEGEINRETELPRIKVVSQEVPQPPSIDNESQGLIDAYEHANNLSVSSEESAHAIFGMGISRVIESPSLEFEKALTILKSCRQHRVAVNAAYQKILNTIMSAKEGIEHALGLSVDIDVTASPAALLKAVTRAAWAARFFQADLDIYQKWKSRQISPVTFCQINELVALHCRNEAEEKAARIFENEISSVLPNRSEGLIENWLPSLSDAELAILCKHAFALGGDVLRALIIAYGVERYAAGFAESIAKSLLCYLDVGSRRSALRFIQKSSAKLDGANTFRRLVCREHLYDVFLNGPVAQITDISIGTADTDIVGHNVVAAVDAIVANLDIISNLSDITQNLNYFQRTGENAASKGAVDFIRTPSGMSGHFRRLREAARHRLLIPLLDGDSLNIRMVKEIVQSIASEEVESQIIEEVSRSLPGTDKIENQHRIQLNRYLISASKQLEAAIRAETDQFDARTLGFVERLGSALNSMAKEGPAGSVAWLEGELLSLLQGKSSLQPTEPCLTGDERSIFDRRWTTDDENWRSRDIASVDFYRSTPPSLFAIMRTLLARGPQEHSHIIEELIDQQDFAGALRLALEVTSRSESSRKLRKKVEEAASPFLRDTRSKLESLELRHSREVVQRAEAYNPFKQALAALRIEDAASYLAILEAEVAEIEELAERDAAAMAERVASAELLARLLRAGDQTNETDNSLKALQRRWLSVLARSEKRRTHLLAAEQVVQPITSDVPEFAPLLPFISELHDRSEDPDWWLNEETAAELLEFLQASVQQLKGWVDVVGILPSETRRALSALLSVFLKFLYDRTAALRSASSRTEVDSMLEAVIEFDSITSSRSHPIECLAGLAQAGFAWEELVQADVYTRLESPSHGRRQAEDFAKSVANAVAAQAWQELHLLAVNARARIPEDEVQRTDEVADFAQAMSKLSQGDAFGAYAVIDGAARAVCTSGHPINRALSGRERNAAIVQLVTCALGQTKRGEKLANPIISWSALLKHRPNLFRAIDTDLSIQLPRVLSAVFTSAFSYEHADLVWSAATNASEAAAIRADLLIYLNEQGQPDVIVKLCSKYDITIKAKIEQMLELRIAATRRPDLIPVVEALSGQILGATKLAPVRQFLKRLPTTTQASEGILRAVLQDDLVLRTGPYSGRSIRVSVSIVPEGVVPTTLNVQILAEDDVTFSGKSGRVITVSEDIFYTPKYISLDIVLGETWDRRISGESNCSFRLRFSAKTVAESVVTSDLDVRVVAAQAEYGRRSIDIETLLEYYPGVGNTPATGKDFVGRTDSLEQLHNFLVASRQPSPVLLTGMRRVGKTSLLQEFHRRHRRPGSSQALSVYLSIAELRQQFISKETTVSAALYRAIGRALSKREYTATDHNRELGERLRQSTLAEPSGMRAAVQDCYDSDSLADSLMLLSERIIDAVASNTSRLIVLLDEAESLIVPYNQGGEKKIELEQLLQSLREISQTSDRFGVVLAGSNHINSFAREYKNAFFGSCVNIDLEGITLIDEATKLISPDRIRPFVEFEQAAIGYAVDLCAGMPQFMWQLGAATVFAVRSGKALRSDVRAAVEALVDGDHTRLPFKSYDVLEPIEHMLGLQGDREQDLLWLLLRRVALTTSLSNLHVPRHFVIESNLLELDSRASWNRRLEALVDLRILVAEANSGYRFKVPLFAEGFRASKTDFEAEVRLRRLAT